MWNGFTSKLFLLPQRSAGFFVVYNRYDPSLLDEITQPLLNHRYLRTSTEAKRQPGPAPAPLSDFAGEYRNTYYAHGTLEKLRVLWKSPARVYLDPHGELMVQEPGENARRVYQAGDLLFAARGEQPNVSFRRNEAGDVTQLFVGTTAYERQAWWNAPRLHLVLLGGLTGFFIASVPVMAGRWGWFVFRRRRIAGSGAILRAGVALCALFNAVFMLALARLLVNYETRDLVYGLPGWMQPLLNLPLLAACYSIFAVALAVHSIRRRESMSRIIRHVSFAIIAIGFVPLLAYWNLLIPVY